MEAEKQVNWTANALALLADLYEYIESQSGDEFASNYCCAVTQSLQTLGQLSRGLRPQRIVKRLAD